MAVLYCELTRDSRPPLLFHHPGFAIARAISTSKGRDRMPWHAYKEEPNDVGARLPA